ncbi:MAG: ABC transporter ATP-binding protein [Caldisericia bacterium]|nr:ABC transporter ATP-binding protein [Caldisericia bacterium]
MLEVRNLSAGYGKDGVLHDVSFAVDDGLLVGVLGPNGSGKSTLIRSFFRISTVRSGQILLDGKDLLKMNADDVSSLVAVQKTTKPSGIWFSIKDFVGLGLLQPNPELLEKTIDDFNLTEIQNKPVSEVSDGQYQRATLAQAAIKKPRLYLLDEPTSHLDLAYKHKMLIDIKSRLTDGSMALAIIHDIDIARHYCDRVILINEGSVLRSGSVELLDEKPLVKKLFGLDFLDKIK